MNLYETDAEFMERFERFAFKEIVNENGMKLDDETRYMSILASLIGCQGVDAYKVLQWVVISRDTEGNLYCGC